MPVEQLTHTDPADRLKISQSVVTLKARVAELQDQLAKAKSLAAGHQADFARERGRADKLEADLRRALRQARSGFAEGIGKRGRRPSRGCPARRRARRRTFAVMVAAAVKLCRPDMVCRRGFHS
jgi:hypothetical protein